MRIPLSFLGVVILPWTASAVAPPSTLDVARVHALVRRLDHDRFQVREGADAALRGQGKAVVGLLVEEMQRSRSFEVRWRLGRIVHDLTFDERVGGLVEQLTAPDGPTRDRAEWGLRQGGASVLPILQRELRPDLGAEQRQRLERIIAELSQDRR